MFALPASGRDYAIIRERITFDFTAEFRNFCSEPAKFGLFEEQEKMFGAQYFKCVRKESRNVEKRSMDYDPNY